MGIAAIMAGLGTRLGTCTDLAQASDVVPVKPLPPCAFVAPGIMDLESDLGDGREHIVDLVILAAPYATDNEAAQRLLWTLMDSVMSAIMVDDTLGGACDCIPYLASWDRPGLITMSDAAYYGTRRELTILT